MITRIKNKFMNMKIHDKLIYSHLFIALIPLLILGMYTVWVSMREEANNVQQSSQQSVSQVQQTLDVYMKSVEDTMNMLTRLIEPMHLNRAGSEYDEEWIRGRIELEKYFDAAVGSHTEIAGIIFAADNDLYVSRRMTRISRDSLTKEKWYQQAVSNPGSLQVISDVTGRNIETSEIYSIDDVFQAAKAVVDTNTGKVEGVLLIDIKHDIISSAVSNSSLQKDSFVFVLDEDNQMLYTPVNEVVYRIDPKWLLNDRELTTVEVDGVKYQICGQKSSYTGWKIVSVSSYETIMENANKIFFTILGVLGLSLIIVLVVASEISGVITRPILKLRGLMKKTEEGDLNVRFEGRYEDEVSELGQRFNEMLGEVRELIDTVQREQESKRETELKLVQEQFKPHFLYNTLDTIGWMAREHSADNVVHMVEALTNLFRISLSGGRDYITVADEMRYIESYLYIQGVRYGSKVCYTFAIEDAVKEYQVPKLITQPLVENAIYHGVKLKRGEGHICIRGQYLGENRMVLSVEDDGKGMSPEKVQELSESLNNAEEPNSRESFGLFYVKERLKIRYGSRYCVKVESGENTGTRISLEIPAEYRE